MARIRFGHAVDFIRLAEQQQDGDALELANRYLLMAIEADPSRAEYWRVLGIIRARIDNDAYRIGAVLALQEAVKLDPSHTDTRLLLAESAASVERYDIAMEQLLFILNAQPSRLNGQVLSLLTRSAIETEQNMLALKHINASKTLKSDPRVKLAKAMLMATAGQTSQARKLLEKIIQEDRISPPGILAQVVLDELPAQGDEQ